MTHESEPDHEVAAVAAALQELDPSGGRTARVLRDTIDQLYDGQRTGRYKWDQLYKTEKTHCGTLVEINLQREFNFEDGSTMDFHIAGVEVDCKYSQKLGSWMIPPEAQGHVCMLAWAEDCSVPRWSLGLLRMTPEYLRSSTNRDGKTSLNPAGREAILWLGNNAPLPPNVLLQMDQKIVADIMSIRSGTQRINELFRRSLGMIVSRSVVATVAQQDDYMKRVRGNGGARTALKPEGIVILGQYKSHAAVAAALGLPVPSRGESISVRLSPAGPQTPHAAKISGTFWKIAVPGDAVVTAPDLPNV